ncbi:uncharacterized protein LOC108319559 [Vigna angularis]|uniref:uncharacterized protein LOC108319559 n=1 Tax=Phaseolus angularis TaxID=3914 RepID=UPI000809ABE0|nr:uncharacterized protein LOC108319559 [Vigna angularis]
MGRDSTHQACKDKFLSCRPIISLDEAFLKGKYGGELLTTVGRDGNEQVLPIAYCVVEVENKDSWRWFLELLVDDLGGAELCSSFTFISDQQKGLLPAIQELLPGVEQRFYVRHLYANFRKKFSGKICTCTFNDIFAQPCLCLSVHCEITSYACAYQFTVLYE